MICRGIIQSPDDRMCHLDDVAIPFATPALLWRTKQTFREKDRLDRIFLAGVLGEHER